jgi:hypothetical protein
MSSRAFVCGYCGKNVASEKGYDTAGHKSRLYICPMCTGPSFLSADGEQVPGVSFGNEVEHLPDNLKALYNEARDCCSVNAYTSSVLACRKLLMNIAVQKGAKAGEPFIAYVEHLASKGYVPPDGRGWVDHIRQKGNEATHEIKLMKQEDAQELIAFAEMLLKFVYEFPAKVPAAAPPKAATKP